MITKSRHSSRWPHWKTVSIALALFALCGTDFVLAQTKSMRTQDCRRVALEPAPGWAFFGEWIDDGNELIIPDVLNARLLRFTRNGVHLPPVTAGEAGRPKFFRPVEIRRGKRELLLDDGVDRIVGLSETFAVLTDVDLPNIPFVDGERVGWFSSFVVSGDALVGMTTVVDKKGLERWSGIARLNIAHRRLERLFTLPSINSAEGNIYFSHPGPYIAQVNGVLYTLIFGAAPHIQKIAAAGKPLNTFPEGYRPPALPISQHGSSVNWYRAWEVATAPVALFGQGDSLYVLARRPMDNGSSQWMLYQIDPVRDVLTRSIELPTHAPHIVVVPGPKDWAIVEKSSVSIENGRPHQSIRSAIFIPTSQIAQGNLRNLAGCAAGR